MVLSVFSEVGQTQRCGGLLVTLVAQGGNNKNNDGDKVGQHLVQLLDGKVHAGGDVHMQDVKTAEEEGSQNTHIGTPDGEDNMPTLAPANARPREVARLQRRSSPSRRPARTVLPFADAFHSSAVDTAGRTSSHSTGGCPPYPSTPHGA